MLIIGSCYAWCSTEHVLKFGNLRYEYSMERRCEVYALSVRVAWTLNEASVLCFFLGILLHGVNLFEWHLWKVDFKGQNKQKLVHKNETY